MWKQAHFSGRARDQPLIAITRRGGRTLPGTVVAKTRGGGGFIVAKNRGGGKTVVTVCGSSGRNPPGPSEAQREETRRSVAGAASGVRRVQRWRLRGAGKTVVTVCASQDRSPSGVACNPLHSGRGKTAVSYTHLTLPTIYSV